ncbi:MAG: MBL fold metallo-hydrolase [Gammaproteobacteria bacterium]|nr:MBL fold metallo-hydrolase [Gammaproteobacteria bacterium]
MLAELHYRDIGSGITEIDCMIHRRGMAASYLLLDEGEAAFIDCGTYHSVPILLAALKALKVAPEQVRYVIPTHVHLDHAGGAGGLIERLPTAQLIVHPRGLRHMIDPGKLHASAVSVYGDIEFQRLFGDLRPVPANRAIAAVDEFELPLGSRKLKFIHSPGHAKHHFCIFDSASHGMFTGDSFGLAYPELDGSDGPFIMPTSTPVQFDPKTWLQTLDHLLAFEPERMYLTHFGYVDDIERLADQLRFDLNQYMQIGTQRTKASDRVDQLREQLMQYTLERLAARGSRCTASRARELLEMDIDLNAQGLDMWLEKLA